MPVIVVMGRRIVCARVPRRDDGRTAGRQVASLRREDGRTAGRLVASPRRDERTAGRQVASPRRDGRTAGRRPIFFGVADF